VYPDQHQPLPNPEYYENWSSLELDFAEFLTDQTGFDGLPGSDLLVGTSFDSCLSNDFLTTHDNDLTASAPKAGPVDSNTYGAGPENGACLSYPVSSSSAWTSLNAPTSSSSSTTNNTTTTLSDNDNHAFHGHQQHHTPSTFALDGSSWGSFSATLNAFTAPPDFTPPHSSKATSPGPLTKTASEASPEAAEPESKKRKRERNTEAARRYRQRRLDRTEELEAALAAMTQDRDELRLKLARSEAEADVLRGLVGKRG